MKKRTKILNFILSIIFVGCIFGAIDYYRAENEKVPLFAINVGKSPVEAEIYVGFGYTVSKCPEIENDSVSLENGYIDFHLLHYAHACFLE